MRKLPGYSKHIFRKPRAVSLARAYRFTGLIPVQESIDFEMEVFPYEKASNLIENAKAWGVRDCICRVQKKLIGDPCDHPVENCLVFAPVEGDFDNSEVDRAISKEEALQILRHSEEAGLVHTTGNYHDRIPIYAIAAHAAAEY